MNTLKTPSEYGYVKVGNIVLFQKGPLSQWYGGFTGQRGGFNEYGIKFNCAEQYMMWRKAHLFSDSEIADRILNEKNPKAQKELGRLVKGFKPETWDLVKREIVTLATYLKFKQNPEIVNWINTNFEEDCIFAEAAPWDSIWGIGLAPEDPRAADPKTWKGQNFLGKAINDALEYLRQTDLDEYEYPRPEYSCYSCVRSHLGCEYAYDSYNINGDCLALK